MSKFEDIINGHHELMRQLFAAERTLADWRKFGFMQEPAKPAEE